MLLPSGRANMRCSVCRFDPRRCLFITQARPPGTGLRSPETGGQNLGYRDLSRQQRPQVCHSNPRKCPAIAGYSAETRNSRLASNCVVAEAVRCEPVSPCNLGKCRVIYVSCRDGPSATQLKATDLKNLDWGLPNSRSREAIIRQQGSDSRNRENRG
jgi:hypothetical protein